VVDIDAALVGAGLKRDAADDSLLAVSNGTAALIYLAEGREDAGAVLRFLAAQPWAGRVVAGADLASIGQAPVGGLLCAVSMRADSAPNAYGIPGRAAAAKPAQGKPDRLGCGQHGGLGIQEQMPFLLIEGPGFAPGAVSGLPSAVVDLAPTILAHLGLAAAGCDGRALHHP